MSYSDYGGLAWERSPNGEWEPYPQALDATLNGILAPEEQPIKELTGMKLDVLANAYAKQGEDYGNEESHSRVDYLTGHPHHVVFGKMFGVALIGHKSTVYVLRDGGVIDEIPRYRSNTKYDRSSAGEIDGYKYALEVVKYPHSTGVLMFLRTPDGTCYAGVVGYGVGSHFWKDDETGMEISTYFRQPNVIPWRTDREWERIVLKWANSVMKRSCLEKEK
jgi:hypothetical protein